jgi:hypothetical protein
VPQSRCGRRGEEKILDLSGLKLRPLGRPARSSLYTDCTILTPSSLNIDSIVLILYTTLPPKKPISIRFALKKLFANLTFPMHVTSSIP